MSFKKANRVVKKSSIQDLFKKGVHKRFEYYFVKFKFLDSSKISENHRVSIFVPKKVFKSAVLRKRVKRRLEALISSKLNSNYSSLVDKHLQLIIVVSSKQILTVNQEKLDEIVNNSLDYIQGYRRG